MKGIILKSENWRRNSKETKRYIASYVVKEKILTIGRALLC